jgi:hypothetical protein
VITVVCVLKSGGVYDAEWVRKLRDGVARNISGHQFVCLSDVEVPCNRIALKHNWPGWWSKIELFRPGVINGPTLYLDLDSVVVNSMEWANSLTSDFAMLQSFHPFAPGMIGSGVMWFRDKAPEGVYEKFAKSPWYWMRYHKEQREHTYVGDQAFIWDALDRKVDFLPNEAAGLVSYKYHCKEGLPERASVVCFHGVPRPTEVKHDWMETAWA